METYMNDKKRKPDGPPLENYLKSLIKNFCPIHSPILHRIVMAVFILFEIFRILKID